MQGTVRPATTAVAETDERIDYELLKRPEPILFFKVCDGLLVSAAMHAAGRRVVTGAC